MNDVKHFQNGITFVSIPKPTFVGRKKSWKGFGKTSSSFFKSKKHKLMTIQFNSAHNVKATEKLQAPIIALLSEKLNRFNQHITRLDVHFSDENGNKEGLSDKRCLLEAHMEGASPIVAKNHANTYEQAAEGAVEKLKASLSSTHDKAGSHRQSKDTSGFEVTN